MGHARTVENLTASGAPEERRTAAKRKGAGTAVEALPEANGVSAAKTEIALLSWIAATRKSLLVCFCLRFFALDFWCFFFEPIAGIGLSFLRITQTGARTVRDPIQIQSVYKVCPPPDPMHYAPALALEA